jgi:hypothetical protein
MGEGPGRYSHSKKAISYGDMALASKDVQSSDLLHDRQRISI